jgi:uncharacterized protein (DUF2147 family)
MKAMFFLVALAAGAAAAAADLDSPTGTWQTIDDHDGAVRALVEITQIGEELQGKIVQTFPRPGEEPKTLCEKCDGERKNKPILGMTFLWGLKKDGQAWRGGEILDPENGSVYDAKLKLIEEGTKLEVRGFLGLALLGRTQVWIRQ